jgi:hypothetical protein
MDAVMQDIGIRSEAHNEKYLGLPMEYMGKSKIQTFNYLKDIGSGREFRVGRRNCYLIKPVKDVLINTVARAIPTYAMTCFDLIKTLCDDIFSESNCVMILA